MILERERLTSVPIGIPISNCDVLLVCENDTPNQGEIYVGGACLCSGYYSDGENLPHNSVGSSFTKHGSQLFFKTGDFARRLQSGDLVFLGRKDRTVKVSGHRIALEEVEDVLRRHPDVVDAAVISVISSNAHGELVVLEAFIVLKEERSCEIFRSSIGSWMIDKLPVVMLPNRFTFRKTLPVSSNGKVDYGLLESSSSLTNHVEDRIDDKGKSDLLQVIKKVCSLSFSCFLVFIFIFFLSIWLQHSLNLIMEESILDGMGTIGVHPEDQNPCFPPKLGYV